MKNQLVGRLKTHGVKRLVTRVTLFASDSWFDEYTYVVAVHKKYLSEASLKALVEEPKELLPWDPFGTLAD